MLPKHNPVAKTAIDLRRSIQRLENFIEQFPNDEHLEIAKTLIEDLKESRIHIPKDLVDIDLMENQPKEG